MKKRIEIPFESISPVTGTVIGVNWVGKTIIVEVDEPAPVSPLPLWGKLPEIFENPRDGRGSDEWTVKYASYEHKIILSLHSYPTRELAIFAWNPIAEALNEVER